ncbi:hypothetical protein H5410_002988 [Solanum commersonii]|uniref:Uncharacterized protein n=1 Tax=Solanum commersonii TaxID=4109 RepID=A0A9J6B4F5_SOLCO|nr:hypothetical protein H5410_002988 [Solanum commersonii]
MSVRMERKKCGVCGNIYNLCCKKYHRIICMCPNRKETTDTKIQKRPRTKTCRKKNENSTTTLLEESASEAVSSSQVEPEFSQKIYKEREKEKNEVDEDGKRAEEVYEEGKKEDEEAEGNKKEVEQDKGKQKEVEEEEGKK